MAMERPDTAHQNPGAPAGTQLGELPAKDVAGEATPRTRRGLTMARRFVPRGTNPYDEVEWETRAAVIQGEGGDVVFEQRDVEMPKTWSQLATNVVVSKYF